MREERVFVQLELGDSLRVVSCGRSSLSVENLRILFRWGALVCHSRMHVSAEDLFHLSIRLSCSEELCHHRLRDPTH